MLHTEKVLHMDYVCSHDIIISNWDLYLIKMSLFVHIFLKTTV